jgi:HK97 family phage portal protein
VSLLFKRSAQISQSLLPGRPSSSAGGKVVTDDGALRQSAVWAALRLRADLMSSFPLDVFRYAAGHQVSVPTPPVLVNPGGEHIGISEFMYSTQMDLDRVGNAFGIITERDGGGRPKRIDLVPHSSVTTIVKKDVVTYRINGTLYEDRNDIWHEKQFTLPGLAVGLSPIAYAAWSLGLWQSAQEFGLEWFSRSGNVGSGHLRNKNKVLDDTTADKVKDRYKLAVEGGDIFVTGQDWEFETQVAAAADAKFLELQKYSDLDAVRFFGVPGDIVDVQGGASSVTYANITQRNLQFLIMNLGPAVIRREKSLSKLVPDPQFVKLNTKAILRMDPETQSKTLIAEVQGKITAPSEARALLERPPFTPDQLAEFEILFGKTAQPQLTKQGATP